MPNNSNNSSSGAKPKTRFQYLLAKLAGRTDVNIQHPKSKDEELLQEVNNRLTDMQVDPGFESSIMITQKAADESVADAIRLTPSSSENASLLLVEGDQSLDVIVRGVATPTFDTDAANKEYVDSKALPAATSADEGKVPTVQADGSYGLENGGGSGGDVLICTITGDTLDKTWNEINSAMASGKVVLAVEAVAGEFAQHHFVTDCQSFGGTYHVTYIESGYSKVDGKILSFATVFKASSATGTLTRDKLGQLEYTVVT